MTSSKVKKERSIKNKENGNFLGFFFFQKIRCNFAKILLKNPKFRQFSLFENNDKIQFFVNFFIKI